MISETTRSRNPAGHAGLLQNLLALTGALADFFESRFALLAEESKAAFVQLLVLASYLVLALILCLVGYVFLIAIAVVGTLIVLLPVRKKKIYVAAKRGGKRQRKFLEAGFVLGASKIAASLLRPVIVDFLKNRLTDYAGRSRSARR